MTKHDLRIVLTLFEHYYILVCPISESMPKSLALQQKYASLFHIKKCSTQYVAHFMWVTNSLKIREYATICSTLYVLPFRCVMGFSSFMDLWSQQEEQLHESLANRLTYGCKPVKTVHLNMVTLDWLEIS